MSTTIMVLPAAPTCRACGADIVEGTHLDGGMPKTGDVMVCAYCAEVHEVRNGETLELGPCDLSLLEDEDRERIQLVQAFVRQHPLKL